MKILKLLTTVAIATTFFSCKKELVTNPTTETAVSVVDSSDAKSRQIKNQEAVYKSINSHTGGYLVAVPDGYKKSNRKYPLIISLHGIGEYGNGRSELWKVQHTGVSYMLANGILKNSFRVNDKDMSFIVITPQFKKRPTADDIMDVINYAKKHYRVRTQRIYLVGISMGGGTAVEFLYKYPHVVAATVTYGDPQGPTAAGVKAIVKSKLAFWGFHNEKDPLVPSERTIKLVNDINREKPDVKAKKTIFGKVREHNCWLRGLNPNYKENGMNVYDWLLRYHLH